jgi:hypothetical protein
MRKMLLINRKTHMFFANLFFKNDKHVNNLINLREKKTKKGNVLLLYLGWKR